MAKGTIKNIVLLLIFLVTTFDIHSKIRHSLGPDDAGLLKLYRSRIMKYPSKERNSGPSAGKKMAASTAISGKGQWCHYLNQYKSVRAECSWSISDGQQQASIGIPSHYFNP